jgi:hypothetical protein
VHIPKEREKFYGRLEKLDRKLSSEKARHVSVGKYKETAEDKKIARELEKFAHQKITVKVKKPEPIKLPKPEPKVIIVRKEEPKKPGLLARILARKPEQKSAPKVVIVRKEQAKPEPKQVKPVFQRFFKPKPTKEHDRFYGRLDELDRELSEPGKARHISVGKYKETAEDRKIEQELRKFAHKKIVVKIKKPEHIKPLPVKHVPVRPIARQAPVQKQVVKPVSKPAPVQKKPGLLRRLFARKHEPQKAQTVPKKEQPRPIIKPVAKPKPVPVLKPVIKAKVAKEHDKFYGRLKELDRKFEHAKQKRIPVKSSHSGKEIEDKLRSIDKTIEELQRRLKKAGKKR